MSPMSALRSSLRPVTQLSRALPASSSRPLVRATSTLPKLAEHANIRASSSSIPPPSVVAPTLGSAPATAKPATASTSTTAPAAPVTDKKPRPRRQIKAKKAALSMTPEAVTRLKALYNNPTEPKLLRIGVKTRGCAGMAYHLDYVDPPGGKFDEVVEQDGVKVLIDSKALFSIIGSQMDWRDNRLSAGFVFENPNIVDTCGCGESFNIKF